MSSGRAFVARNGEVHPTVATATMRCPITYASGLEIRPYTLNPGADIVVHAESPFYPLLRLCSSTELLGRWMDPSFWRRKSLDSAFGDCYSWSLIAFSETTVYPIVSTSPFVLRKETTEVIALATEQFLDDIRRLACGYDVCVTMATFIMGGIWFAYLETA